MHEVRGPNLTAALNTFIWINKARLQDAQSRDTTPTHSPAIMAGQAVSMTDADSTELWPHLLRYSDLPSVFLSSYCHSKHSILHILVVIYHLLLQSAITQLIYLERVFCSTIVTLESIHQQVQAAVLESQYQLRVVRLSRWGERLVGSKCLPLSCARMMMIVQSTPTCQNIFDMIHVRKPLETGEPILYVAQQCGQSCSSSHLLT